MVLTRYFIYCFFVLGLISQADGQSKVDSLKALLNPKVTEEVQNEVKIQLSKELRKLNADESLDYGLSALGKVDTSEFNESLATLYMSLGRLYLDKFQLNEAYGFYNLALDVSTELGLNEPKPDIFESLATINYHARQFDEAIALADSGIHYAKRTGNKKKWTSSTNLIGSVYMSKDDYPNALIYFEKFRKLAEEIDHQGWIGLAHRNLGVVYAGASNHELAIKHEKEALRIARERKDTASIGLALNNLGNSYTFIEEDDKGLEQYLEALTIAGDQVEDRSFLAGLQINIGRVYYKRRQWDTCILYTLKGLALLENQESDNYYRTGLYMYGNALVQEGDLPAGIKKLERALELSELHKDRSNELAVHENLSLAYGKIGNIEKSFFHYIERIDLRDSLINEEKRSEMTATRLNFKFERQQLSDSLAAAQVLLTKEVELAKKKNEQRYIMFGLFLVLALLGLLYRTYRDQVKSSKIIAAEKEEAERQKIRAEKSELKVKELDATKNRLYTNIAHEFRTPLTVITGMAEQIKENPDKWMDVGLEMMGRNGYRLLGLVNQMLDLSKLESGNISLNNKQNDIINYLNYLSESLHSFFESRGIELIFEANPEAYTMDYDEIRLQQVVINLLSNAVKFTPPGGQVFLLIDKLESESSEERLQIKVKDSGQGISEQELPYIFDRFYQVDDSMKRKEGGSGIGLALVKELVKLMKGEILVSSQLGVGTTFTVSLPISRVAQMAAETTTPSSRINKDYVAGSNYLPITQQINPENDAIIIRPSLLIIEDNPDVVTYLQSCLDDTYDIAFSVDGQQGIDKALEEVPDVIITDVMMPKKDGFEVCQALKTDTRTSHIPIIMLTARADIESKLTGLDKGADAYLSKPFDKKELRIRLKKLLELRSNLQAYYASIAGFNQETELPSRPADATPTENEFVKKMRGIVDEHLDDHTFGVEQFSQKASLSSSQLNRKLSALINMTANKFIREIRLAEAKKLLKDKSINVSEIAYSVGFNNPGYFSRLFKKEVGMTPAEWRNSTSS